MLKQNKKEDMPWFSLVLGIPAVLAWIAFGAAVLLAPHLATEPSPIAWAGYTVAAYGCIVALFTLGPIFFLAFS